MIYSKKVLSLILTALMVQSIFVTGGTVTASSYETTQESSYAQVQTAESKSAGDFTYSVENNGVKILKYTGTDTEVTIPNKIENLPVTAIGDYAFSDCHDIIGVEVPNTVTDMGSWTFCNCENLQVVNIPNGVTRLRERLFLNCYSLVQVNIPETVTVLEGWCFERCDSITSITIPYSVTEICESAFLNAKGLKTVNIPHSVTKIWNYAFCGTALENITIPNSITEIGIMLFENCTSLKTVTLENGITNIGQMLRKSSIKTITLPESMTYLSNSAFEDCLYLSEVNLPSKLETIDNYAFWNCDALTTINIPETVTKIGYQVFGRCDNLSSVTIPKNVTDIGGMWFVETPNLKTVTFEEGTTKIGNALQHSCIESFDFPASLETLSQYAFANCNNLTSMTIPDTVKQIDGWTFSECENLETVVLPNTIQNIPERMFLRCHSLTSVNIPASVKSLDGWCFEECTSFTSFTIPDTVNTIHNQVFQYCSGLKTVTIPNSVTELENELFKGCTSLEQITIPHSVTKLGDRLFGDCTSLENITIPDSVTEFGGCIFEGCTALKTATLENGITNIGQMFRNSYIETITLPESMTYLSNSAFEECRNLKSVTLPDNMETIDRYAFYKCESLEDITIPDKVQKIDYQTFLNAGLKTVTLPANLNLIDTDAFAGCTGLEKVYYRNTVANWGNNVTVNDGNECLGGISSNAEMYFFPDTLTLNKTSYRMDFEDTYNLKYTFAPQNSFGKYTWKSSNSSVVKVTQSGKITAVNEGTANITVTHDSGLKAVCKVTVNPVPKTLELDKDTLTLFTDDTYTLQKSFTPSDAKAKYTWSSSDTQVAAVDSDGKVTAISAGTATITLRSNNGLTATCDVTVWRYPDSVSLDKTSIETGEGLTEQLTPQLSPDDSHTKSFTWTSSDENIATVSQDGLVTAVRKGTATIKVTTSNGKSAQCVVTVKELPQSVKLSKSSTLIKVGSTERIKATITPSDAYNEGYTWKSSDKTIAAVSSTGLITAKKAGIATITYRTANGKTAKCTVTVVNVPESVAISKTSLTLAKGGTEQLSKAVTPEDADAYTSYTWTSSNESVASVSENGFITAKEVGTATVTVTTDNGKSASCTVEVRPAAQSISLDKTETVIKVGTTQQLTQTVTPSTAYTSYKWSSSDPDVVSVSESGVITANSTGTAVITVETDNGKSASCTVTSKEVESVDLNKHSMTLGVGQAYTLRPSTTPDDIESTFTWKSSNKDVATVTSKGKVTGRAVGKATITVRTDNGKICTCTVVVKQAPKDISLNKTEMTLGTGQMYTLQSTLTPSNSATYQQWTSSDTSVAVVNANGRVTAKKVGTAVITVKTTNNHTATCTVTVKKAPTSVALNKTAINVGVGQKYTLTAELTPTDSATYCMWSSDDTEIAEVNSNGVVTGKAAGTANITVKTTNGKTATCKVTVKKAPTAIELDKTSLSMKVKETYTLVKTLTPTNSAASYIWSSSDTTVATVSSVGKVTAKKAGTAIITVTTHNGKTASCTVEVR